MFLIKLIKLVPLRFPEASEVLLDCAGFVLTGASYNANRTILNYDKAE
jgi:hypothetical protein